MNIHSITRAPEIESFRLRQTIRTTYRDMPSIDSTSMMLIEARRDPPAVQTTHSTDAGSLMVTLMIDNDLWTRIEDSWVRSDIGDVPEDWTLRAYREIGDMSLVAPLTAQAVIDAARETGSVSINNVLTTRLSLGTNRMVILLMEQFAAQQTGSSSETAPPDSYINHYEADFWVNSETGFVIRERTVVEYAEKRLHEPPVGTGPATFETTREFFDFNAEVDIVVPSG